MNTVTTPHVRVLLYCFKPPFPSDGGCAAASAGRSGLSPRLSQTVVVILPPPTC
jgi:hypothetical protein